MEATPDGDAELDATSGFRLAACNGCGSVLKPSCFFGENVPHARVAQAYTLVDALSGPRGALLVARCSLTVLSGLRLLRHAHRLGVPVVIVNRGLTRGDDLADVLVNGGCSDVLPMLTTGAAS